VELVEFYPVLSVCQAINLPRSTYYYQSKKRSDEGLERAIEELAEAWPKYGYRRITQELRRKDWVVNGKRVRRLMREMGLQVRKRSQKRRTTDSRHHLARFPNLIKDLQIIEPDQVWAADITYVRLRQEFVYLAVIMDLFTRGIRGWHLSRRLDHSLTLTALEKALTNRRPTIHHSDQGVQYAAVRYVEVLKEARVQISMAQVGQVTQNAHVERLIRTIKEEEVDLSEYVDCQDAYQQIGRFIEDVYMYKRIHSALDYLTPVEFESQWHKELIGVVEDVI
jgi:transposase InsO family protein